MRRYKIMVYTPGTIANSFLERAKKHNKPITPLQLQKLMYFAQGWWLTDSDDPLINEPFEAWEYGPVCSSVYHEFKHLGNRAIGSDKRMLDVLVDDEKGTFDVVISKPVGKEDDVATSLLDFVWEKYSDFSGVELSAMTHFEKVGNPWIKSIEDAKKQKLKRGISIPNQDIQAYFKECAKNKEFY